jgi:P4 family phage/plasmid primase-like protien
MGIKIIATPFTPANPFTAHGEASVTAEKFTPSEFRHNIEWALDLAARGWRVFPCSPVDKTPMIAKWKEAASNKRSDVLAMFDRMNMVGAMVGVACGAKSGIWCLDPDAPTDKNPIDGRESWNALQAEHGAAPPTHTHLTPGGGQHLIFAWRGDRAPITNREGALKGKHINVRGEGGYFIAVGSVNADGVAYTMADPSLYFQIPQAPDWLHDLIDAKAAETELPMEPGIRHRAVDAMGQRFVNAGSNIRTGTAYAKAALVKECAKLAAINIDRNISLNNSAMSLGGLVKAGQLTEAEVVAALVEASVANGLDKEDGRRATLATIASGMGAAVARVIPLKARSNNVAPAPEESSTVADDDDSEPPAVSETEFALADDFIAMYQTDLRYVAKFGKWQVWRGTGWKEDETVRVFDLARRICRLAAANKEKPVAKAISKARTVAAVETLARSYPSVAATVDQWDTDPMRFNVLSGTIDLTTGSVLPHDRLDYITKIAACNVAPVGTPHPIWSKFLARMTAGDADLISFLQRWMGYCLTGNINEHGFVFGHGGGANGKSTFITFVNLFGDYATISNTDTFTESHNERHTTEIAKLRGARLVVAQEVEEGKQWNETRIKSVTGGDKLTARFMRQDDFEFYPQFKLFMMGNNKPTLRNVDEAMRRRLMLVPFIVTIPEAERDHDLANKLQAEWPAILRWAVDGCLQWQRIGLAPPEAVKIATNEYFAEQDTFSLWLDEACVTGSQDMTERSADLYESWAAYLTKGGATRPSSKSFSTKMIARGFVKCTIGDEKHRGFKGVRLKLTQEERNFQSPKF